MRFLALSLLLLTPFLAGCGEDSSVPQELRAPPLKPMTPETQDPKAPKGAAPVESPF
ncbi:MAG: hypothetical protein ACK58L_15610 [Planctomycetota bacterium]